MDVSSWLRDLGLENYAQAFRANDIDAEVLSRLSAEDLIALGVTSVGHRRKLLDAIARLQGGGPAPASPEPIAAAVRPAAAERRQLTVLFCDLVGSTELAARLDPEDLRGIMGAYQRCAAAVVERFEGHIAKYLGDGVLAYFGWPKAHEDDAERAVRAGLALVEAITRLDSHPDVRLQARVGIATGIAVVGDLIGEGAAREEAVVGDTPNLAARLQALAAPGSVVIGEATRRLIGGLFELADLGPQRLKGFAEPLAVWRVAAESRSEGRFEARQTAGLTPLVGREEEISLLLRRWRQAQGGEGQVVLLSGEPGIGKSRLVREVRARLADEPHIRLLYQCSPYHATSPLHPIIEQLERGAGFVRDDPPKARLDKLENLLARGTDRLDAAVPLIAAVLGVPVGERYPLPELTPQRQKQRTLEVLVDQLEGLSAEQPVLLAYEDVHWVDPTTQALLELAIERVHRLAVLLLITFRPEFTPPWSGQPHVSALALTRLGRRDGAAMVEQVVGDKALPAEVGAQIIAKTDGVPLFVEELTKAVLESGLLQDAGDHYELAGPLPPLAIPATLHDSLLARLDRLAPVKEVAQIGAAIGREFSHTLLAAVADRPEPELQGALDQLVAAELVFRRGVPPAATYSFKHALVQDAAYGTLLKSRRHQLHARIADALKERFRETTPEMLAHHLTEAGLFEQAVPGWFAAGERAIRLSTHREAVAHYRRGLEVLGQLAEPAVRTQEEIRLQNALGFAQMFDGPVPEAEDAYLRARELAEAVGDRRQRFEAVWGLWFLSHMRLDLEQTARRSNELLNMIDHERDSGLVLEAHHAAWSTGWPRGELEASHTHAEAGIRLYRAEDHHGLASAYGGHDPGVCCRYTHGLVSWLLGYPDQAVAQVEEALALARRLQHPLTLIVGLMFAAFVYQFRREPQYAQDCASAVVAQSIEQNHRFYRFQGRVLEGWAGSRIGEPELALVQIHEALADACAIGADARRSYFLALLADACLCLGRHQQGLAALTEALDLVSTNRERWWEAEVHRLRGELLLAQSSGATSEAEACFEQALGVARSQSARSLELRAATSLARLWRDQGRRVEASDLLAPIYGWFTEGFDTADLKDAKGLLDELA